MYKKKCVDPCKVKMVQQRKERKHKWEMLWIQQKIKTNRNKNKESDNANKQCHLLKDEHEVGWQMYLAHIQFQMTMDLKHSLEKPSYTNQNHSISNTFYFIFSKIILFHHCLPQASKEFCIWVKLSTSKEKHNFHLIEGFFSIILIKGFFSVILRT